MSAPVLGLNYYDLNKPNSSMIKPGSGSQALTENVRHVKIFPSTGQALSMTPKDNTLGKCIRDTIARAVPTLPSKPRTYGNGTRSSLTSTETVLNAGLARNSYLVYYFGYLPFLKQNTTEPPFSDEFTLI
uniref:Putative methyl-accepting chemotaxis AlkN n=1 Tax=Talaromyces marneffei PM1 TaxID=1077442 RepID=A0A093ULK9_TALMA